MSPFAGIFVFRYMDQEPGKTSISNKVNNDGDIADNPESPSFDAFDRYLAGCASEAERAEVEAYIKSKDSCDLLQHIAEPTRTYLAPRISSLGTFKNTSEFESVTGQRMWTGIVEGLAQHTRASGQKEITSQRFSHRFVWGGSFLMIALSAIGIWFGVQNNRQSLASSEYAGQDIQAVKTIATGYGQRVNYRLPDGSAVLLAPGSTIKYSETFGINNRHIALEGEALFTVTQDDGIPFVVTSGQASVRVLGTAFSVRRYSSDSATSVVVAEGKVSVGADVLTSGTSLVMTNDGKVDIDRAVEISRALAWTNGKLVFRRTGFDEVIDQLERWLDVDITVEDKALLQRQITGEFLIGEPDAVISSISSILNAKVVRTGKVISFTPVIQ